VNGGNDRVTGDRMKGYYIPGAGGGVQGSHRTDLTFKHDETDYLFHVNTVDTWRKNGVNPHLRELQNAWEFNQQSGMLIAMVPEWVK